MFPEEFGKGSPWEAHRQYSQRYAGDSSLCSSRETGMWWITNEGSHFRENWKTYHQGSVQHLIV